MMGRIQITVRDVKHLGWIASFKDGEETREVVDDSSGEALALLIRTYQEEFNLSICIEERELLSDD